MEEIENYGMSSDAGATPNNQEEFEISNIEDDIYFVEEILEKKIINGVCKYKIKWKDYPYKDCTWEPIEHLENAQELLIEFEERTSGQKYDFLAAANAMENCLIEAEVTQLHVETSPKKSELPLDGSVELMEIELNSEKTPNESKPSEVNLQKQNEKAKQRGRKSSPTKGSLKFKDVPRKVLGVKPSKEIGKFMLEIDWKPRANGSIPLPSRVSNVDLKRYYPTFLLDYYETKINLVPKKKSFGYGKQSPTGKSHQYQHFISNNVNKLVSNPLTKKY